MRKAVLISIQPPHIENICTLIEKINGKPIYKKSIEVRKTAPQLSLPFTCYIYATKSKRYLLDQASDGSLFWWDKKSHHYPFKDEKNFEELYNGKVIGEFVCDRIRKIPIDLRTARGLLKDACLSAKELEDYRSYKEAYGWHISDLKIYDKPKELGEFKFPCQRGYNDINNAWCYRERGARLTMCKYNDMKNNCCNAYLTRPPQSWCYVEAANG